MRNKVKFLYFEFSRNLLVNLKSEKGNVKERNIRTHPKPFQVIAFTVNLI